MKSKVLFVANTLATLYVIYLCSHFWGGMANADGAEAIGGAIATALVTPHIIMFLVGAVFCFCFLTFIPLNSIIKMIF